MIWIKLCFGSSKLLIGAMYRQTNASIDHVYALHIIFCEKHRQISNMILGGDFNLPNIEWDTLFYNRKSLF